MIAVYGVVGAVALQRLAELAVARHNTQRLKAAGAVEVAGDGYPAIVALHIAWLGAILVFAPPDAMPNWPVLAAYSALQVARYWTMASLGRFWTTRLITLPAAPLVRRGPYRFVRHPNYLVVAAEIALLPLSFGLWELSIVFTVLNGFLLLRRIKLEDRVLMSRG